MTKRWNLDSVLQETVDAVRSLTVARYGAAGVFDDSGQVRDFITSGAALEDEPSVWALFKEQQFLDYLKEVEGPLRLADLAQHLRTSDFPENLANEILPRGAHPPSRKAYRNDLPHREGRRRRVYRRRRRDRQDRMFSSMNSTG